jgi:hypothetical protein
MNNDDNNEKSVVGKEMEVVKEISIFKRDIK